MNNVRDKKAPCLTELPRDIVLNFDTWPAPERKHLRPTFKRKGTEKCLAKLKVKEYSCNRVVLRLPESLACHGPGRYEICVLQQHCKPCDCVEVVFKAGCGIDGCELLEIEYDEK